MNAPCNNHFNPSKSAIPVLLTGFIYVSVKFQLNNIKADTEHPTDDFGPIEIPSKFIIRNASTFRIRLIGF